MSAHPASLPQVTLLLLNWNGWQDTVECLASLQTSTYPHTQVVVLDNGSSDGSLVHIAAWAAAQAEPVAVVHYGRSLAEAGGDPAAEEAACAGLPLRQRLILVDNGDNLGFAAGNNIGIRFALQRRSDYVLLLNNDTVVAPQAVEQLVNLLQEQPALVGATAQLRYYDSDHIWNCGGDLTWYGGRRYHLHGAAAQQAPARGWRPVTFITGCAAFFRTALFSRVGLLSERFFFGEEDFELSQRLKRSRLPLACCYAAVVRHKVSRSVDVAAQGSQTGALANKVYLYYLNRFIDMRGYFAPLAWQLWRLIYSVYIFVLLTLRLHFSPYYTLRMLLRLWSESGHLHEVSSETFHRVLRGQPALEEGAQP